jgi:hypothetical protein
MAIDNFNPTIWSQKIFQDFDEAFVFGALINRNYEGEIRGAGDSVKINAIGPITVSSYTKNSTAGVSLAPLVGVDQTLLIDQQDYFGFYVDDIDKAQQSPKGVMGEGMRKAGIALADTADARIAGLYASAGTMLTTASFGPSVVAEQLTKIHRKLDENNVPFPGRWLAVPPWAYEKLVQANIGFAPTTAGVSGALQGVDGTAVFEAGRVGKVLGFDVYMTNNLTAHASDASTTRYHYVLAGNRDAITFADQIVNVEAFRPETMFSDAVKGLHVYGMKVVAPKALVACPFQESTV